MKSNQPFNVKMLIMLASIFIGSFSPVLSQANALQHSAAEKQQIALAKKLHHDFSQGNYKAVYDYFSKTITQQMPRSVFDTKAIPVYRDIQKRSAALTEKSQHTYLNSRIIHSVGAGQPQSGKYTTICYITTYQRTPVRKELCFTWFDNNLKVAGFHFRLDVPKNT